MKQAAFALPLFLAGCLTPHQPPPAAPYLATGHAPEWSLVVDERNISFLPAGSTAVTQPTPPVIHGFAGEIYQTSRLNVNIVHAPCTDTATGRVHPDRVQVSVDGRRFEGCGGGSGAAAPTLALAGSSWRVIAVNGQQTPTTGDYSLSFDALRMTGRLGCNGFGGGYIQSGTQLDPRAISATRMACAEPAMSFERDGLAVLSRTSTISWNGNVLSLSNGAGRVDLSRSR